MRPTQELHGGSGDHATGEQSVVPDRRFPAVLSNCFCLTHFLELSAEESSEQLVGSYGVPGFCLCLVSFQFDGCFCYDLLNRLTGAWLYEAETDLLVQVTW